MNNASVVFTPAVQQAQAERGSAAAYQRRLAEGFPDTVTPELAKFIAAQDTAFLATANADGAPYIQHRGGPRGFLKVLGPNRLGFADFRGNRQLLSTGNLNGNERVCLFLMDYPHRERLKIIGHAQVLDAREQAVLADQLTPTKELRRSVERLFIIDVLGFDWNCSQYIAQRYTLEEFQAFELNGRICSTPE